MGFRVTGSLKSEARSPSYFAAEPRSCPALRVVHRRVAERIRLPNLASTEADRVSAATPIEAVNGQALAFSAIRPRMRSARLTASLRAVFGAMIVNSSPPQRAAVSVSRSSDLNQVRDLAQRFAAGAMAVAVVNLLQSIDIEKEQTERLVVAACPLRLGEQPRRKSTGVEELGERILLPKNAASLSACRPST